MIDAYPRKVHNFRERNAWSLAKRDEPFWESVYRKAFPNLLRTELCSDLELQLHGIDRILHLSNGHVLYVDEKKREKDYPDILLEYQSSETRPGWIEKDGAIDYLAYAFIPTRRCYLFPWAMLRRAWLAYGEEWKAEYQRVPARNETYTTWSIAIPIPVLRSAVSLAAIIQV